MSAIAVPPSPRSTSRSQRRRAGLLPPSAAAGHGGLRPRSPVASRGRRDRAVLGAACLPVADVADASSLHTCGSARSSLGAGTDGSAAPGGAGRPAARERSARCGCAECSAGRPYPVAAGREGGASGSSSGGPASPARWLPRRRGSDRARLLRTPGRRPDGNGLSELRCAGCSGAGRHDHHGGSSRGVAVGDRRCEWYRGHLGDGGSDRRAQRPPGHHCSCWADPRDSCSVMRVGAGCTVRQACGAARRAFTLR